MNRVAFLLVLVVSFSAMGCGDGPPVVVPVPPSVESIKKNLESVAESGSIGSEMMAIDNELAKLAVDDAEKAATVKAMFEQLKAAKSPAAVKAKAKEILSKL